jgi:hypothetical protein
MTLLRCLQLTDTSLSTATWCIGFCILSGYYFILFLYGLIPICRFHRDLAFLSAFGRLTRMAPLFAVLAKSILSFGAVFVGHYFTDRTPNSRLLETWGLSLIVLPSYLIASVYSLVVGFSLSVCRESTPGRYLRLFQNMKWILICYNLGFYLLFASSVIIEMNSSLESEEFRFYFSASTGVAKDFILCLIFMVFVINLRPNSGDEAEVEESRDERRLFWFSITLSVFLLVRGTFALVETLAFQLGSEPDCGAGVYVWFLVDEIAVEGFPLAFFIYCNHGFLKQQSRMSRNLHPSLLGFQSATYSP